MSALRRRVTYRPSIVRSDYFMVRAITDFVRSALKETICPAGLVIDVGCGEQPWRGRVESAGGRYVGIDVQQNAMGTVCIQSTADHMPISSGIADLILCTEVLEHVPDPSATLREFARVLRPGAKVIITTPFLYPLHERPRDLQRLTVHGIEHLLTETGFRIERSVLAGNEVEVFATLWDRLWTSVIPTRYPMLRIALLGLLRLSANVVAGVLSALGGSVMPKDGYLNSMFVVRLPRPSS